MHLNRRWSRFISRQLRCIGRMVPVWLPHGTAIGNRILKPMYRALIGCQQEHSEIWPDVVMRVSPCDGVGGNLFFSPQLYDRDERSWIDEALHGSQVFVDVGANVGVYSLWAARMLSPDGTILAIEADPLTFRVLRQNLAENATVRCKVLLENTGVSDKKEALSFYRNTKGNSGGNTFFEGAGGDPNLILPVEPLDDVVRRNGLQRIDFMKIDIEGLELKVLTRFFGECRPHLLPSYVLIEMDQGPRSEDLLFRKGLLSLFARHSYQQLHGGDNALFHRLSPARG